MFVKSQAIFLHTQSQTTPTFPGDKEEDVVIRLTIAISRGGQEEEAKKVRGD